ncbi:MAG: hypothetical protein HQ541_01040 [Mariniphaga sp.]|nr:hypothetical protein [Mariniphaga sp.]
MKTVTIEYPVSKYIKYNRFSKGSHPENWDEVTPTQLITIACLYKNSITLMQFLNKMIQIKIRILKKLDQYQLLKLTELVGFVSDFKPFKHFVINKLDCDEILYSPKPKLKGMSFGQFIFADTYFNNYRFDSKQEDLNKFIASLYLPENKAFDEDTIDQRSELIANLDIGTKEAIAINYQLIWEWLCNVYPLIFQKQEQDPDTVIKEPVKKPKNNTNWIKILDSIVGDNIINMDKYTQLNVHTVLRHMTKLYKDSLKRK